MATEEIQISELELADEVLADMVLPVDTATDTKAVTLKQLKAWLWTSLPIGSIFASVGKIDDERFSLLDGKTISRIGTYEAFCNKVVENVQAGKWKACTEEEFNLEVSETGQCGKFVVSNDYVRIPKLGNSLCSGIVNGTIPVVGNGGAIVYTNGNQTVEANLMSAYGFGNSSASIASFGNGQNLGTWNSVKLTTNPTKSGIEGKINSVEVFYYMVISTEGQTASVEIDINKVYEDLNIKANTSLSNVDANIDYVVEKGGDSNGWYRVYKSGWIEQGGLVNSKQAGTTVTLLKPYANANYLLLAQVNNQNVLTYNDGQIFCNNKKTTNFKVTSFGSPMASWFACGQGA